jgi:cytochrome c
MSKSVQGICALAVSLLLTSASLCRAQPDASPNPGRGKLLFLRCAACHSIGNGGAARIGPDLGGVVGRKAGSLPGYAYSAAMKSQNFVWDAATLDRWLTRPNDVVPGTAMAFGGMENAQDRQTLIDYLAKFPAN